MSQMNDVIAEALAAADGGMSVRDLMRALRAAGHSRLSRSQVERALESTPSFVSEDVLGKTRWLLSDEPEAPPEPPVDRDRPLDGLTLRDWQIDAFAAWVAAGCRGVIEAVTGSGKSRVGTMAVRAALAQGGRALIIAPTLDLQDQWVKELREFAPQAKVGRLGGGHGDDLHTFDVVVATPHSASAVPIDLPTGAVGLLVADECHRMGAPTWAVALRECFQMRLALTATLERADDGVFEILAPYFGSVVHAYGYREAAADGVIAPFEVAFVGTSLDTFEQEEHDKHDRRARQARRQLAGMGLPSDPRELFAAASAIIAQSKSSSGPPGPKAKACVEYLTSTRARRDVAVNAAGKLVIARLVAPALAQTERALVFCDTVDQCELVTKQLVENGVNAETIHSELTDTKRRIRMAQFRNDSPLNVVVAPRVLDEGIDLPSADRAVVLASFRSRRQMVQRLGRVLRVKDDGREARLMVAFASGTNEDPKRGAHREFIQDIAPVARNVEHLDADANPDRVAEWLMPTRTPETVAAPA